MKMIFPPGWILIFAALLLAFVRTQGARGFIAIFASALAFAATLSAVLVGVEPWTFEFLSIPGTTEPVTISLLQINRPTPAFATVFALITLVGVIYSLNQKRKAELPAAFLYAGSAISLTFAGDLLSFFIYWELMAIGSTIIVCTGGQPGSRSAGLRYAVIHGVGGALLMAGLIGYALRQGDMSIPFDPLNSGLVDQLKLLQTPEAWLFLIGILINAAAPLLGSWLPDAYPEASESGSVFLSAFTTKSAVFALMMFFAGAPILIAVGLIMAIYGIIYAILENDMRRLLAHSLINQVGFMICAVGIGTELSLSGASAHAFAHIIYKALLFMTAGSVLWMTGERKLTALGGLYKAMPVTMVCTIIGAMTTSALPLTSGFTTKSMITAAAAEQSATSEVGVGLFVVAWFVLIAASAGAFLHAGLKYPWFVFFHRDSGKRPTDPPWNMQFAMIMLAVLCVLFGVWAQPIHSLLPYDPMVMEVGHGDGHGHEAHLAPFHAWTLDHVITQLLLLVSTAVAFFMALPALKSALTITLDFDWFYRKFAVAVWNQILAPLISYCLSPLHRWILVTLPNAASKRIHPGQREFKTERSMELGSNFLDVSIRIKCDPRRQWVVGSVMIVVTLMLMAFLLIIYSS